MVISSQGLQEHFEGQKRRTEEEDAKRRAQKLGYPYLDLISTRVPTELKAMELVAEAEARKANLAPLQLIGKELVLAVLNPGQAETKAILETLGKQFQTRVFIVSAVGLQHAWSHYQYISPKSKQITGSVEIGEKRIQEVYAAISSLGDFASALQKFSGKTSELLEVILGGALALRASDVHLEPAEAGGVLRLRVDGLLHSAYEAIDIQVYHSLITRIKLLSNLKLNISKEPQDGRFTIDLRGEDVEIRTSVIPSEYGEAIVLRILLPSALQIDLEKLGFREDDLKIIREQISRPNGLILNTGPTGSGKTTTLYAFLKRVYSPEIKVITIEDPIEYHLPGISQTQINPDARYTFASGLRSILRQDPDVILVGEIRDRETAEIALNASLTGHLVFSTLHTNDAVGAVPRLYDLGVKRQVLGPALSLVIAQRLVRVLCPKCKQAVRLDEDLKKNVSRFLEQLPDRVARERYKNFTIFQAGACEACGQLGYKGRTSIFELFVVQKRIEELIYTEPTEIEIAKFARECGMVSMQEDGVLKVLAGVTSFEEVERLTGEIEWGSKTQ
ncbi:MAG: GspE/PulE family protein [bacterium]|nr:GspE/PulE family protein [bacterium]